MGLSLLLKQNFERYIKVIDQHLLLRLLRENFSKHMRWYGLAISAMVIVAVMTALSAWVMRDIINEMLVAKDISRIFVFSGLVAVIFFVKGAAAYVQGYYLRRAGNSIVAEQQRKIFHQVLRHGVSFFQEMHSSDLVVRFTQNVQSARNVIDAIVTSVVRDSLSLIGLLCVMILQQPLLSLVSFGVGPFALLGIRVLIKKSRAYMKLEINSLTDMVRAIQETVLGIRVVKSFALEGILQKQMDKAISDTEKMANRMARLGSAINPIVETLGGIAIAGVIAVSGVMVLKYGNTPGELMSFITALLLAYEPAKRLAQVRVNLANGMIGVRLMFELLDRPFELHEDSQAIPLPSGPGTIEFKGVDFSYGAHHYILENFNLCFQPGQKTALVGPSGGGKTTIINLIMRLYDPQSGKIEIDGADLRSVTLKSLRERIAFVGQDPFLFAGSIKYNIGLGRHGCSDKEIIEAAKAANAHHFIEQLPHGYDTILGENGAGLSGGQKQRLTIARAMLRNSDILILDEPTSALDSESESLIREALDRLTRGRTTIIIAHRMSTIVDADHIVVIEKGKVVETGSHGGLLLNRGLYSRLHHYQIVQAPSQLKV